MNLDDMELKFLAGMPVEIENCGFVHIPTVREIISIGEGAYNEILSVLLLDKSNLIEDIPENTTNFQIVYSNCYHSDDFKQKFLNAVNFIFKKQARMSDYKESSHAFFYFDDGFIHSDNFDFIQEVIRVGNHISKPKNIDDEFRPAGAGVAKYFKDIFDEAKKMATPKKQKEIINLHSIISGLAWKSGSPNIEAVLNLTNYQLYDGFKRIEKIDSVNNTLLGIYTGNIDAKKINSSELTFAKIIEIKEME